MLNPRSSPSIPGWYPCPLAHNFLIAGGFEVRPLVRGVQGRSLSVKLSPAGGPPRAVSPRWSFAGTERGRPGVPGELVTYLESGRRPRCSRRSPLPLGSSGVSSHDAPLSPSRSTTSPPKQGQEEAGAPRAPRHPLRVPTLRRAASAGAEGSLRLPAKSQSSPRLPRPEGDAGVPPARLSPGPAAVTRSQSSASLPPRPKGTLRRSASLGRGAGGTPLSIRAPPGATLQRGRQPVGSLCQPAVPESSF